MDTTEIFVSFFIYLLRRAWNIFYLMSHIVCGKDINLGSGRTTRGLKFSSYFWKVSWHVCRFPSFFPGCWVLRRGYWAKWTFAVVQQLHQPHVYRGGISHSALPTSNTLLHFYCKRILAILKVNDPIFVWSSWDLCGNGWRPSRKQHCPSFS